MVIQSDPSFFKLASPPLLLLSLSFSLTIDPAAPPDVAPPEGSVVIPMTGLADVDVDVVSTPVPLARFRPELLPLVAIGMDAADVVGQVGVKPRSELVAGEPGKGLCIETSREVDLPPPPEYGGIVFSGSGGKLDLPE